jgi:HEAT repeat protein
MTLLRIYPILAAVLMACALPLRSQELETLSAEALVQQLRNIPSRLPAGTTGNSVVTPPVELLRGRIYNQLLVLHPESVRALAQGFQDPDVEFRRNIALAFGILSGGWWSFDGERRKADISAALPTLIATLDDADSLVRAWAAQAIGNIGPNAAAAVPALVALLATGDEAARNSACIALRGIGPVARPALSALRVALSDPSADVRRFAERAIKSIEGQSR